MKMAEVIALKMRLLRLLPILARACSLVLPLSAYASGPKPAEQAETTLFRDKGCAYCHGAAAQRTKGSRLANVRKTLKPAQITAQIKNGG